MSTSDFQKRITHLVQTESLQEMINIASDLLDNPCFVVDMSQNVLIYSQDDVKDPHWKKIVVDRQISTAFIESNIPVLSEHASAFNSEEAMIFHPEYTAVSQIKKALVCNKKKLGLLMVIADRHEFTEQDLKYANIIGDMIAYKMLPHEGFLHQQSVQKNTFFSSLIDGAEYSSEQIDLWLKTFGVKASNYYYICVLKYIDQQAFPSSMSDMPEFPTELFSNTLHAFIFTYHYSLAMLIPSDIPNLEDLFNTPEIERLLEKYQFSLGISTYFQKISELKIYYHQAAQALSLGSKLMPEKQVLFYDQLILFDLVSKLSPESADNYIHPDIARLRDYDQANNTELCKTLFYYLENNHSLSQTAKELYLHKNTINYRVNQCKDILNSDLRISKKNFIYVFSLAVILYRQK